MVNFSLNARERSCEIYVGGVLVETVAAFPIEQREARLRAHGWKRAKVSRTSQRGAKNGYGWTKSAGIRRGA